MGFTHNARAAFAAAVLSLFAGCGMTAADISSEGESGFYTMAGQVQSWPQNSRIQASFGRNFPYRLRHAVALGASTYNDLLESVRIEINADSEVDGSDDMDPQSVAGDGVNGVYWLEETWPWAESHPDSDAMTVVRFNQGSIVEADVYFRARSYASRAEIWATTSENRASRLPESHRETKLEDMSAQDRWLYLIAVHEFGHALGRAHVHDHDSIMAPAVSMKRLLEPFTNFDLEVLSSVYPLKSK